MLPLMQPPILVFLCHKSATTDSNKISLRLILSYVTVQNGTIKITAPSQQPSSKVQFFRDALVLLSCTVCNEFILLSSCSSGAGVAGVAGRGSSGAGHGGNGGVGSHQVRVGAAIGDLYEPDLFGCKGGGNGGLGGGKMKLVVNGTMKIDGTVSCIGQTGSTAYSGGGSGGSIWIVTNLMRGYGQIQVRKLTFISMRAFLQIAVMIVLIVHLVLSLAFYSQVKYTD